MTLATYGDDRPYCDHGFWTEERREFVRVLLRSGMSFGAVAVEFGVTRNAIAGLASRLGLKGEGRAHNPREGQKCGSGIVAVKKPKYGHGGTVVSIRAREAKPDAKSTPPKPSRRETPAPPESKPVTLLELTSRNCHFPLGSERERATLFCGAPAVQGSSYCGWHCRIAYAPSRVR